MSWSKRDYVQLMKILVLGGKSTLGSKKLEEFHNELLRSIQEQTEINYTFLKALKVFFKVIGLIAPTTPQLKGEVDKIKLLLREMQSVIDARLGGLNKENDKIKLKNNMGPNNTSTLHPRSRRVNGR